MKGGGGRRLMSNTVLNFHFDHRHTSLSSPPCARGDGIVDCLVDGLVDAGNDDGNRDEEDDEIKEMLVLLLVPRLPCNFPNWASFPEAISSHHTLLVNMTGFIFSIHFI